MEIGWTQSCELLLAQISTNAFVEKEDKAEVRRLLILLPLGGGAGFVNEHLVNQVEIELSLISLLLRYERFAHKAGETVEREFNRQVVDLEAELGLNPETGKPYSRASIEARVKASESYNAFKARAGVLSEAVSALKRIYALVQGSRLRSLEQLSNNYRRELNTDSR